MAVSESTARSVHLETPPEPRAANAADLPSADKLREMDRALADAAEGIDPEEIESPRNTETTRPPAENPETPQEEPGTASVSLSGLLGNKEANPAQPVEQAADEAGERETPSGQPERPEAVTETIVGPPPGKVRRVLARVNSPWHRLSADLQHGLLVVTAVTLGMSILGCGIAMFLRA